MESLFPFHGPFDLTNLANRVPQVQIDQGFPLIGCVCHAGQVVCVTLALATPDLPRIVKNSVFNGTQASRSRSKQDLISIICTFRTRGPAAFPVELRNHPHIAVIQLS